MASAVAPGAVVNTNQMRVSLMSMPASWRPAAMAGRLVAPSACSALTVGPVCRTRVWMFLALFEVRSAASSVV